MRSISNVFKKLNTFIPVEKIIRDPAHVQTIGFWTSAIVAGLASVLFARLFRLAEMGFHKALEFHPLAPFLISPPLFLLAWYLVNRFAPEAGGSGIPQVMAANEMQYNKTNRATIHRLLSLKTAAIKVLSAFCCVLGGGAVGREGPTLQISASIFHFFGNQTKRFTSGINEQTWVVAGAAAGLASAFNTPLGGIVYAIEELGLVHFHKIRTALLSSVIVSGLVAQWLLGSYLYLGLPKLVEMKFSYYPVVVLSGLLTGLLGALFGKILFALVKRRNRLQGKTRLAFVAIFCGLLMAIMTCFDQRTSGSGIDLTTDYLFTSERADVPLLIMRYFGTIITYMSGAAGGIFSPSLTIGATIGSFLSTFVGGDMPNIMVLLGMIGFLTGVTRTPFTSFILVLEMTDRYSVVFPMMLVALTAQWIAYYVDPKSFYEHMKSTFMLTPAPFATGEAQAPKDHKNHE